jgi:hypothetical protein
MPWPQPLLDLALVLGVGEAGLTAERARLGERQVVVGMSPVGDDRGQVDDAADPRGAGRLHDVARAVDVDRTHRLEVPDRVHLEREVDDDVDALERRDQLGVTDVHRPQREGRCPEVQLLTVG